jgi:GNAT superfamily N-acetyltransferase
LQGRPSRTRWSLAVTGIVCTKMTKARQHDAVSLLSTFLRRDKHYLASSAAYGDQGLPALKRAIRAFLRHPRLGFVWLAYAGGEPVAVCVVCYAISTSIGGLVAKLDDLYVAENRQRQGVATAMLKALVAQLRRQGARRIDTAVVKRNRAAERYYAALGFKSLGEERLALLL